MNKPRVVAFQGEHGAYSEQAALNHFGITVETLPCRALQKVFGVVEDGGAEMGVIPVENSLEGSINLTYDLLLESNLRIIGEIKHRITHCLVGPPGTRLEDIKVVYSHPQALAQCSVFLDGLGIQTSPTYDTAGSVKMIKERRLPNSAAIASEHAAETYGLTVLRKGIEDYSQNFTRFFVISKHEPEPSGRDKTTIVFGTKHAPGALHRALGELADRGINLTKIESRPVRTTPWEYYFFVDFEGHSKDYKCAEALEALRASATFLKVLGSYPRATDDI